MLGNVAEWCEDTWHDNYISAPADGSAWIVGGDHFRRVRRGGDWFSLQRHCRSASRAGTASAGNYNNIGFRVILESASGNPSQ
jgi:formylglycine-generating enzyme required for sulfatase activity